MRITKLTLQDFGPLAGEHEYVFPVAGAISVTGANGRGKSHIIAAIRYVLTGSADRPLCQLIRGFGALPDVDRTIVVGEFETADGRPFTIKRTLSVSEKLSADEIRERIKDGLVVKTKATPSLSIDGKSIRAASEIEDELSRIADFDGIAGSVCFVGQDEERIFDMAQAGRTDRIQALSGASKLPEALKAIAALLPRCAAVLRDEDIAKSDVTLADFRKRIRDTEGALQERLNAPGMSEDVLRSTQEAVVAQRARQREIQGIAARLTVAMQQFAQAEAEVKALPAESAGSAELGAAPCTYEAFMAAEASIAQLQQALQDQKAWDTAYARALQLPAELSAATQNSERLRAQIAEARASTDSKITEIGGLTPEIAQSSRFIETFKLGTCPTCGEPLRDPTKLQALQTELPVLQQKLAAAQAELQQLRQTTPAAEKQLSAQALVQSTLQAEVAKVTPVIQQPRPIADEKVLAQAQALVQAYREYETKAGAAKTAAAAIAKRVTEANTRLELHSAEVRRLTTERDELQKHGPIDDASLQSTEAKIAEYLASAKIVAEATGTLESLKKSMAEEEARKAQYLLENEQNAKKIAARDLLTRLQTICHRDALPKAIAMSYVGEINLRLAVQCQRLMTPFTLLLEPETCTFFARFEDKTVPVALLSGGQKTMAAWAWTIALHEKHSNNVKLLALDEPTRGLDEANLLIVRDMLSQLVRAYDNSERQLIVITHEKALVSAFSHVIEV